MSTNRTITFTLNDAPVATTVGTHQTLLEALQAQGLTGARESCAQGLCGCCTVLVDGAPRVACVTPVRRVAGRVITTVDGLAAEDRARWSEALLATGGSQCGFCTPGFITTAHALLTDAGANAILVGESLMREADLIAKARELLGS